LGLHCGLAAHPIAADFPCALLVEKWGPVGV